MKKKSYENRTQGYKTTINNDKKKTWTKKIVFCHKSASDGGAPVMMCGKDEEPWPSAEAY